MRCCTQCKLEKPLTEFYKRSSRWYRPECKECFKIIMRKRSKEHYSENKDYYRKRNKRAYIETKQYIFEQKLNKSCIDCKLPHPPHRLQFDHLPGTVKRFEISVGPQYGLAAVKKEMIKCELVCANCHADRTFNRLCAARGSRTHP